MATLDLLRGYYGLLAPLLDTVACAPLPEPATQRASSLHQRAWLLQLHALELHRADAALAAHGESVEALLAQLFAGDAPRAADSMGQGRSRMLDLLELVTGATPAEPQLGRDAHPEVCRRNGVGGGDGGATAAPCMLHLAPAPRRPSPRPCVSVQVRRMLQALELDALLASTTPVPAGGVRSVSHRGVGLYDVVALKDELLKRYARCACHACCCGGARPQRFPAC